MNAIPRIHAEITFLSESEGGRKVLPIMGIRAMYRPHIVIQDRDVRTPIVDADRVIREAYLGIQFDKELDAAASNGTDWTRRYELSLMYFPRVDYDAVVPSATFTVREGGRIVGHGIVLARLSADG